MAKALKYLFTAYFKDGSSYVQNEEDKSLLEPDRRSCFYDVLQREEELQAFSLTDKINIYTVHLIDGSFEINGATFKVCEEALTNIRIIFFRKNRLHFNAQLEQKGHEVIYRLGWQANLSDGTNIQRVLEFE